MAHVPFACWLTSTLRPGVIVEVNHPDHAGQSTLAQVVQVIEGDDVCLSTDATSNGHAANPLLRAHHAESDKSRKGSDGHRSRLIRCGPDESPGRIDDGTIDLLYINGEHTHEKAREIFESWQPKLSRRAVVLLHGTEAHDGDNGVYHLWTETKRRRPSFEFTHEYGLGVLAFGADQADDVAWLTHLSDRAEIDAIRRVFASLGGAERARLRGDVLDRSRMSSSVESVRAEAAARARHEATELRRRIAALTADVEERDSRIAALSTRLSEREGTLAAVLASTSWRLGWPIRVLGEQKARIRRAFQHLASAIRRTGGLQNTFHRAVYLFRHEGMTGVRRGFRIVATGAQVAPTITSGDYDRNDYAEWVRRYDTLTEDARLTMHEQIGQWPHLPLFSVIMPTCNSRPEWLIAAIESVRGQIYDHWQLCIADDASTDPETIKVLERYRDTDSRISVIFRSENGHIAAASNTALSQATGDWVVLLDHDDVLAEHALFWVAHAINTDPDAALIYSDEDKIGVNGERRDPYFKTDWNPELFYSHNMFCHLGAYRADLMRKVGGFCVGTEGAQDYDLVLRCIEAVPSARIHHIPRVLYHWRMHPASTSASGDAKPYAVEAGRRAIEQHFERSGMKVTVEPAVGGYRVKFPLPEDAPLVSLLMPTRNGLAVLQRCVDSILHETTYPNFELLVIDNASDDPATLGYLAQIGADPRVRVIRDTRPFNFSALNNAAAALARGEFVALVNNDLEVIAPDWLSEMVSLALRPGVGAVGAKLLYPDDTVQHGGVIVGIGGVAGHAHKRIHRDDYGYFARAVIRQSLSAVTAACLLIRKSIYLAVGGLNEKDLAVAFNDVDFCLRVRDAGYRNVWTPLALLYHHESASRGFEDTPEKQARFEREVGYMRHRWGDALLRDPAYNPNLTLMHEDFSLAWPPRARELR